MHLSYMCRLHSFQRINEAFQAAFINGCPVQVLQAHVADKQVWDVAWLLQNWHHERTVWWHFVHDVQCQSELPLNVATFCTDTGERIKTTRSASLMRLSSPSRH